jgi:hypothetical protein
VVSIESSSDIDTPQTPLKTRARAGRWGLRAETRAAPPSPNGQHPRAITPPPATNRHPPLGVQHRQWPPTRDQAVHFDTRGSSPNPEYQRSSSPILAPQRDPYTPLFPIQYYAPAPAMPRAYGAPEYMPQYAVPVFQPAAWPQDAYGRDAYGQQSEATPYARPLPTYVTPQTQGQYLYSSPHVTSNVPSVPVKPTASPWRPQSVYDLPITDQGSIFNFLRSLHDMLLLGLPLLYHRRLARVREKADLPQPVVAWAMDPTAPYPFHQPQRGPSVPHASIQPQSNGVYRQLPYSGSSGGPRLQWDGFRDEWESFVSASIQEWQTLNIISALLLRSLYVFMNLLY